MKKFFQKFFSGTENESEFKSPPKPTPSQSTARVISMSDQSEWRKRAPRVQVTPLHRVSFRFAEPASNPSALVFNVSVSGIGLIRKSVSFPIEIGTKFEGKINIAGESYSAHLVVMRSSETTVGCRFTDNSPELKAAIQRYFKIELAALGMMKVDPRYHKKDPAGDAHWIHGEQCDLFFVTNETSVLKFRMTYLGNHLEVENGQPPLFGTVSEDEPEDKPTYKKADQVEFREDVSEEHVAYAVKFLENIPHLQGDFRRQMIGMVEFTPRS